MGNKQKTPNDMRSDSMNPNNELSRDYIRKLERIAREAEKQLKEAGLD